MKRVLIAAAAVLFLGCGSRKEGNSPDIDTPPGPGVFGLMGVAGSSYASECTADEDQESQLEVVVIAERSFELRYYNHEGVDCQADQKLVTYVYRYTNVVEEKRPEAEGLRTFVYEVGASTTTVHTELLARKFSKRQIFGYGDWVVDVEKEINGRKFDADSEPKLEKGVVRMRSIVFDGDVVKLAKYKAGKLLAGEFIEFRKM